MDVVVLVDVDDVVDVDVVEVVVATVVLDTEEVFEFVSLLVEVVVVLADMVGAFGAGRLRANHIPCIPCPLTSPGL